MERYRRGKGKQGLLGSHQRCWIWGRNAVLETLAAGRWPILELYFAATLDAAALREARSAAASWGPTPVLAASEDLTRRCHSTEHQGYLAKMAEFPYRSEAEILHDSRATPAFHVILDRIQDPYNLGAILRSAEVFGVHGVFLAARGGVGVTSMVARSSAGAVNRVPIARVASLMGLADGLRAGGVAILGASEKAKMGLPAADWRQPLAVIIGNEGQGIEPELAARCTALVRIPQQGRIGSLNAAAAAAVFFYEVQRQRQTVPRS